MPDAANHTGKAREIVISLREVYKSFDNIPVLQGINLDIMRGENVAILGRSGTGKSVLIKLIAGLLKPDSGTITVLGQDTSRLSKKELRKLRLKIGFIFQGSALFDSMTVGENLEFSLVRNFKDLGPAEVKKSIEEILDALGLPNTESKMPSELSGGQKKRVGMARTLVLHPEIMLYDEPTGGLDPITSVEINELINTVQGKYNATSIIITHDLTCAKATADRLFILENGQFIREGNFEDVFSSDDPRIKKFYDYNFISSS
jgi:phospholipid/cholesterol/gamma-HCH transport system ATP-binding protein